MTVQTSIYVDLTQKNVPVVVAAKQLDEDTRRIAISLTADGIPFTIPSGTVGIFELSKPDGTYAVYDSDEANTPAVIVTSTGVVVTLIAPALSAAGRATAQVALINNGERLTSFSFMLDIQESAVPDGAISEDYVNIITGLVSDAQAAQAAAEAAAAAAEAAAANTVKVVPQTFTEVQQAQARTNINAAVVFTSLAQIGCTADNTLLEVAQAMPDYNSVLVLPWCGKQVTAYSGTTFGNALPASYGSLWVFGKATAASLCKMEFLRYTGAAYYEAYRKNIDVINAPHESPWELESSTQTGAFTFTNSTNRGNCALSKKSGIVYFNVDVTPTMAITANSTVILTFPSGYRPIYTLTCDATTGNQAAQVITISPNGQMLSTSALTTDARIRFTGSFIAGDN